MMKTLEQIEPRCLIESLPHTIKEPGAYYITNNLSGIAGQNGITIEADNVTLDLGGWTLFGVGGSLDGIFSTNHLHIVIRNGNITAWNGDGINLTQAAGRIEDIRVHRNGGRGLAINTGSQVIRCTAQSNGAEGIQTSNGVQIDQCVSQLNVGHGIAAGTSSTIRNCYANGNTGAGIVGGLVESLTVLDCVVNDNHGGGIIAPRRSLVRNCQAWRNYANGIFADAASTVIGCTSGTNALHGIEVGPGSVVSGSTASFNAGNGFTLGDYSSLTGCASRSNAVDGVRMDNKCLVTGTTVSGHFTGAGFHATKERNRIEGNTAIENRRGFYVEGRLNLVVKNNAADNALQYDIAPGNHDAAVISPGSGFFSDQPWANFQD